MRHFIDNKLNGHGFIFDGVNEMINMTADANDGKPNPISRYCDPKGETYASIGWDNGRTFKNWADLKAKCADPWAWGVSQMKKSLGDLNKHALPQPVSRKRKGRWSDEQGEVDCDRALAGEPEFFRQTYRTRVKAPNNLAILCNLDGGGTTEQVFCRGAAAIAAVDLLEAAGYSCEVWAWQVGYGVFKAPNSNQFTCCRLKECGAPVNTDALINALSAWFMRCIMFGSFATVPNPNDLKYLGSMRDELGEWEQHMDITENCMVVKMPVTYDRNAAATAAIELLNTVIKANE